MPPYKSMEKLFVYAPNGKIKNIVQQYKYCCCFNLLEAKEFSGTPNTYFKFINKSYINNTYIYDLYNKLYLNKYKYE